MGLDMYSYSIKKSQVKIDENNNSFSIINKDVLPDEFMYWRKHNALHKWMEDLYVSRKGKEEFNCVKVILNESDLLQLKEDILNDRLIYEFYDTSKKNDLSFIDVALSKIDDDVIVYYDSWW